MTRLPSWLWGLMGVLALALGVWKAGAITVAMIRADERAAVLREGDALLAVINTNAGRIARERDSVTRILAQRDTQLTAALAAAGRVIERIVTKEVPVLPASLLDTAATRRTLTALRVDLTTCRDTLAGLVSACTQYRQTSDSARAVGARQRTADSTALVRMAEQTAAISRSRDAAVQQLSRRSTWRTVERSVCAVSAATNLIQWRYAK